MLAEWGSSLRWRQPKGRQPHEAVLLKLDSSKARGELGWKPRLPLDQAISRVVEWHRQVADGADAREVSCRQLDEYEAMETIVSEAQAA